MKLRVLAGVLSGFVAASLCTGLAVAQADPKNSGYVLDNAGKPNPNVVRSGTNLCWRTGFWTPAMAIAECDPDLVKKPEPPKVAEPPKPAEPAKPQVKKITLSSKALFDFDKAVLKPEGKKALDTEVVARLKEVQKLELVLVTGHTDRLGSQAYNQKLSEKRANAVKDHLAAAGVPKDKIETLGMGKTQPVPGVKCDQTKRKELIACLQPHRRVEVEVKGEAVPK
ncbi:Outer membrane protein A [Burkholderiales bacterium]|nr:Outer membrane protein A [Burkholderiales bacterium]